MKQKLNRKGFTLVELLVVIAIIGILSSIVLVSLNSARERAQKSSLQSTMSSINTLASLCVNDGGSITAGVAGNAVCDDSDITAEVWPDLDTIKGLENAGFEYGTMSDTQLIATDGTNNVIVCTVATGNCDLQ